ncbi:hypothetical protein QBC44DRAFT_403550 [Cladorrhinum sp. PSN332]|nr:hypothetical protein QBC44DRAFT_403550 [Cladorrhinum sp. PSN332]
MQQFSFAGSNNSSINNIACPPPQAAAAWQRRYEKIFSSSQQLGPMSHAGHFGVPDARRTRRKTLTPTALGQTQAESRDPSLKITSWLRDSNGKLHECEVSGKEVPGQFETEDKRVKASYTIETDSQSALEPRSRPAKARIQGQSGPDIPRGRSSKSSKHRQHTKEVAVLADDDYQHPSTEDVKWLDSKAIDEMHLYGSLHKRFGPDKRGDTAGAGCAPTGSQVHQTPYIMRPSPPVPVYLGPGPQMGISIVVPTSFVSLPPVYPPPHHALPTHYPAAPMAYPHPQHYYQGYPPNGSLEPPGHPPQYSEERDHRSGQRRRRADRPVSQTEGQKSSSRARNHPSEAAGHDSYSPHLQPG